MSFKKTRNETPDNSVLKEEHVFTKEEMSSWHPLMYDVVGRFRTTSLFWETRRTEEVTPLFTTKDRPHTVLNKDKSSLVTYPSLKQIYMSYSHAPGLEYEFALDVFGSWECWDRLTRSMVKDVIQQWRDELTIKLKADALKKMMIASLEASGSGVAAARYLADEGYTIKKVGRMTKEEKTRQLKLDAGIREDLASDMERLGIKVVSGGV